MGFNKRLAMHDKIQEHVLTIFKEREYACEPYGIESGKGLKIHKELVRCGKNPTANYIRHQPDKALIIVKQAFLVDIKTQLRYDTENYSVELASYDTCMKINEKGCDVFYIFNGGSEEPYELYACFVNKIEFFYKDLDPEEVKGSGTPFGLIRKKEEYLVPLDKFLDEIEGKTTEPMDPSQGSLVDFMKGRSVSDEV